MDVISVREIGGLYHVWNGLRMTQNTGGNMKEVDFVLIHFDRIERFNSEAVFGKP